MNEYLEKLRSISTPRRLGQTERRVIKERNTTLIETERWDGSKDAAVRPDVVRYGARTHNTGKKKGQTAEVRPLKGKERKERYGEA